MYRGTSMEERMATTLIQEIPLAPVACCTPVASPDITAEQADVLAAIFKALADPHRVRIVNLLANATEPVCVCDFMPQLGLSQGTVSFHLKKLLDVGLLEREQRGTWAYYSLKRDGLDRLAGAFVAKEG
jgi:ArsR family transcriptional regulator